MIKGILSVFGKSVVTLAIVFSLTASACNNTRNDSVKVRENKDGDKEVRIKERHDNDSVSVKRDVTIEKNKENDTKGMGTRDENDNTRQKDNTNKR